MDVGKQISYLYHKEGKGGYMGIWDSLIGRKTYCAGCGAVVPARQFNPFEETYCSETCNRNVRRISSFPPPPSEEELSEVREIPFSSQDQ